MFNEILIKLSYLYIFLFLFATGYVPMLHYGLNIIWISSQVCIKVRPNDFPNLRQWKKVFFANHSFSPSIDYTTSRINFA